MIAFVVITAIIGFLGLFILMFFQSKMYLKIGNVLALKIATIWWVKFAAGFIVLALIVRLAKAL
jgi:hypothetical protein